MVDVVGGCLHLRKDQFLEVCGGKGFGISVLSENAGLVFTQDGTA